MLINTYLGGLVRRSWILLYVKSLGQIKLITMIGGPAQVPIAKSPRSQKECVNSNYFENIKTCTDDGQDPSPLSTLSTTNPSRTHHRRRNYCQHYHHNYDQLQQSGFVVAQGNVFVVPLRSPIVSAIAVGLTALDNLRLPVMGPALCFVLRIDFESNAQSQPFQWPSPAVTPPNPRKHNCLHRNHLRQQPTPSLYVFITRHRHWTTDTNSHQAVLDNYD
jgi:hypothetical protein